MILCKFKGGFRAGVEMIEYLLGEGKERENVNMRETIPGGRKLRKCHGAGMHMEDFQRVIPRPIG